MLRGILTVGGWTMGSRLLGFARDMLIAALAGTAGVADAFFVANKLPNMFRRLFGEGAFNAAFVPEFTGLLATEGIEAAKGFAQQAIGVLAFWLLGLTVLGEIFMPQLMQVLAPGFREVPGKFALAVDLARITFPYLILICLAALLSGVLNGLGPLRRRGRRADALQRQLHRRDAAADAAPCPRWATRWPGASRRPGWRSSPCWSGPRGAPACGWPSRARG